MENIPVDVNLLIFDKLFYQDLINGIMDIPKYRSIKIRENIGINKYLVERISKDFTMDSDTSALYNLAKSGKIDPLVIYQLLTDIKQELGSLYANGIYRINEVYVILGIIFSKKFLSKITNQELLTILNIWRGPSGRWSMVRFYPNLRKMGLLHDYIDMQLKNANSLDYLGLLRAAIKYYKTEDDKVLANEILAKILSAAIASDDIGKIMEDLC